MNNKVTISEVSKDYDRIYSTHGLRGNIRYYKWIVSILGIKNSKGKLLDVACGEGLLLRESKKLNPNIDTFGLDISKEACVIAKKNSPESYISIGDGQKIPFSDQMFDFVTCLGSLEHYIAPEKGAKEIVRVLKNNGIACFVLPNTFSIDTILDVIHRGEVAGQFQIIEREGTKNEWIELLEKNELQVEKIYKSNSWPELFCEGTFKIKSIRKFIKRGLIKCFCPFNLAREFVFVCSKGSSSI